uniref:P6 n=1 Tax=Barley yellow dwarf virus (isolate PAV) TaxID=2169986 RepID=A0A2K9QL64_BYDVP|nr:P6 [Barley yellow dwarf virus PAV]
MDDLHVIAVCVLASTSLAAISLVVSCFYGCVQVINAAHSV